MSNEKTVIDLGSYRLVKLDRYNYEMEEFRKPDSNHGKNLVKDDSPKWRRMGHYFQSIASGVSWLLEHRMRGVHSRGINQEISRNRRGTAGICRKGRR